MLHRFPWISIFVSSMPASDFFFDSLLFCPPFLLSGDFVRCRYVSTSSSFRSCCAFSSSPLQTCLFVQLYIIYSFHVLDHREVLYCLFRGVCSMAVILQANTARMQQKGCAPTITMPILHAGPRAPMAEREQ